MTLREIIEFIEDEIEANGQSNRQFLTETGYSLNSFYGWREGTRSPRTPVVIDMLDTLGYEFQIVPKRNRVEENVRNSRNLVSV